MQKEGVELPKSQKIRHSRSCSCRATEEFLDLLTPLLSLFRLSFFRYIVQHSWTSATSFFGLERRRGRGDPLANLANLLASGSYNRLLDWRPANL